MVEVAEQVMLPPKSHQMWAVIGMFGFSNYLLRTVLGYIAVSMDHETPSSSSDNSHKAIILSSFFLGYASNNVISGILASRLGGLSVLHAACAGWSSCATLIPFVFDQSGGSAYHVGLVMFFLGVCCAPMFPASQMMLSFFSTPSSISMGTAIRAAGTHGGSIMATFATPVLLHKIGWRAVLQAYGGLGLLLVMFSVLLGPTGGNQMKKSVSLQKLEEEAEMKVENDFEDGMIGDQEVGCPLTIFPQSFDKEAVLKIISDLSVQSAVCTHMAVNLAHYTLLSYMPTYFVDVLHMNLADTAPFIGPSRFVMLVGVIIAGYISKYVLHNQILTLTQTRRGGACVCLVFIALAIFALPLVESPVSVAVCLSCSTLFIGAFEVFLQSTYIDLSAEAPEFSGFVSGFGNTMGAFPGALGPFFVSQILSRFESWVIVFWVISFCLLVATFIHHYYGSTTSISFDKNVKL